MQIHFKSLYLKSLCKCHIYIFRIEQSLKTESKSCFSFKDVGQNNAKGYKVRGLQSLMLEECPFYMEF